MLEVIEEHTVTIKLSYECAQKLKRELDVTGMLMVESGKDPAGNTPAMTELYNKLP